MLHWLPTLAGGTFTGQDQAAWSVAGNSQYVVLGGEFPSINGVPQQGLARFAVKELAPNQEGPQGHATLAPTVTGIAPGTARLTWQASWDRDNERLTYEVLRGPQLSTATVIGTGVLDSAWFRRPMMGFTDTVSPPGSSQSYRIRVTDPLGNTWSARPWSAPCRPARPRRARTATRVAADGALDHWRLGEASGVVNDYLGDSNLTPVATATRNVAGAHRRRRRQGDHVPRHDDGAGGHRGHGADGAADRSAWRPGSRPPRPGRQDHRLRQQPRPATQQHATTGTSTWTNDGKLVFGVQPGVAGTITSADRLQRRPVAPRRRHAQRRPGMKLYVDGAAGRLQPTVTGASVYTGYWRVGGDTSQLAERPTSNFLAGTHRRGGGLPDRAVRGRQVAGTTRCGTRHHAEPAAGRGVHLVRRPT